MRTFFCVNCKLLCRFLSIYYMYLLLFSHFYSFPISLHLVCVLIWATIHSLSLSIQLDPDWPFCQAGIWLDNTMFSEKFRELFGKIFENVLLRFNTWYTAFALFRVLLRVLLRALLCVYQSLHWPRQILLDFYKKTLFISKREAIF